MTTTQILGTVLAFATVAIALVAWYGVFAVGLVASINTQLSDD